MDLTTKSEADLQRHDVAAIFDPVEWGGTEYAAISQVHAYWDRLRGPRRAPRRSDIDPSVIADALDRVFMADFVAPGIARLRVAGHHLNALMGMEVRGMPLSALFSGSARDEVGRAVAHVGRGGRAQLALRAERGLGRPPMDAVICLLPLEDGQGNITRILGVLATMGQIGRAPRRFVQAPQLHLLRGAEAAQPLRNVLPDSADAGRAAARRDAARGRETPGRGWLRVIAGGKPQHAHD